MKRLALGLVVLTAACSGVLGIIFTVAHHPWLLCLPLGVLVGSVAYDIGEEILR